MYGNVHLSQKKYPQGLHHPSRAVARDPDQCVSGVPFGAPSAGSHRKKCSGTSGTRNPVLLCHRFSWETEEVNGEKMLQSFSCTRVHSTISARNWGEAQESEELFMTPSFHTSTNHCVFFSASVVRDTENFVARQNLEVCLTPRTSEIVCWSLACITCTCPKACRTAFPTKYQLKHLRDSYQWKLIETPSWLFIY